MIIVVSEKNPKMQKEKATPATLANFHPSKLTNVQTFYPTIILKEMLSK